MIIARTQRLVLRQFTRQDAPFILRLLNEPSYLANIGDRGIRIIEDAEDYCVTVLQLSYMKNGFGLYAVSLREDEGEGTPIGFCGLVNRDGLEGVDLGYAFLPDCWGNGYAREACQSVIVHAQHDIGLKRLAAIVAKHNASSAGLLKRLGFVRTGEHVYPPTGEVLDLFHLDLG